MTSRQYQIVNELGRDPKQRLDMGRRLLSRYRFRLRPKYGSPWVCASTIGQLLNAGYLEADATGYRLSPPVKR